jgi:uncharacterized protein with FMN-binding domain
MNPTNQLPPPEPSRTSQPDTRHPTDAERQLAERLAVLRERRPAGPQPNTAVSKPPGRRHAAQGARRAALGLSLATTGGLAGLFALSGPHGGTELAAATIQSPSPTPAAGAAPAAAAPTPARNVVVDGAVFHNKWGNVQVEATFDATGSLIDVTTLQTPGGRAQSIRINDVAVPRLTTAALSVQSANVDTVSGATYTSIDYRRSLQSAIDAARAAGATPLA